MRAVAIVVGRRRVLGVGPAVGGPGEIDEAADLVGAVGRQAGVDHGDADTAAIGRGAEQARLRHSQRLHQVRFGRADVDERPARHRHIERDAQHARQPRDQRHLHERQFDRQGVDQRVLRDHAAAERGHQSQDDRERSAIGPDDHARRAARQRRQQVRQRLVQQPPEELTGARRRRQHRGQRRREQQDGQRPPGAVNRRAATGRRVPMLGSVRTHGPLLGRRKSGVRLSGAAPRLLQRTSQRCAAAKHPEIRGVSSLSCSSTRRRCPSSSHALARFAAGLAVNASEIRNSRGVARPEADVPRRDSGSRSVRR